MALPYPRQRLCCGSPGMLSLRGAGRPRTAPSSQLSPWLRLSPSGGLVSVLPSACPPSLQTVPICLALAAGWSWGHMPGPPVHNGSLFTASLPARPSPALAIIPISCALSLLPSRTTDPRRSCSAPVAATLLPLRTHLWATRTWAPGRWLSASQVGNRRVVRNPGVWGPCWILELSATSLGLEEDEEAVPGLLGSRGASPVPLASASAPPNHLGGCCPSCPSRTGCSPCLAARGAWVQPAGFLQATTHVPLPRHRPPTAAGSASA